MPRSIQSLGEKPASRGLTAALIYRFPDALRKGSRSIAHCRGKHRKARNLLELGPIWPYLPRFARFPGSSLQPVAQIGLP
jgi:hypothetical protein